MREMDEGEKKKRARLPSTSIGAFDSALNQSTRGGISMVSV
jgi:hypothetical protein